MHNRRTKIVATLGPQTRDLDMIERIIVAGVDVVRINGSHGSHDEHARAMANVRTIAAKLGRAVGILFDLQGPKIRLGAFDGPPVSVNAHDTIALSVGRPPLGHELPCDYPYLDRDVVVGAPLLIDDGKLVCTVVDVQPGTVVARANNPGLIGPRKGINLPNSAVSAPAISAKDKEDVLFAVRNGADFIAMSFVRKADDIHQLRALIDGAGGHQPIIAKIEKPQALDNLEDILEASWGVMVARGDLGVELSPSLVPMAQKRIIRAARAMAKPVITATQMLDSMTHHPGPTRAEASDVANAVLDGTDAVMLSQETAVGLYPVQTVQMMGSIIDAVEQDRALFRLTDVALRGPASVGQVLAQAACSVAQTLSAPAIASYTETGRIALCVSQRRPIQPIIAFATTVETRRRLTLVWGIASTQDPHFGGPVQEERLLDGLLVDRGLARPGDHVVLMVGAPNGVSGTTHAIMVHTVKDRGAQPPPAHGQQDHVGAALW